MLLLLVDNDSVMTELSRKCLKFDYVIRWSCH